MDGLGDIPGSRNFAEGGVCVGCTDVTGGAEDFADILGEVPAIGVPGAVKLDCQRAGGDRLGWIPGEQAHHRVVAAGEVDSGDLQVASVDEAAVECYAAVDRHLFVAAAALAVVGAFHHGIARAVGEAHGAVLRVVDGGPDAVFCLDERLVTICIELRNEGISTILGDGGVLVESIRCILCAACHAGALFESGGAVAYIVVGVLVVLAVDLCLHQLRAGVVGEGVVHHGTLSGGIAGGGAAEGISLLGDEVRIDIYSGNKICLFFLASVKNKVYNPAYGGGVYKKNI